MTKLAEKDDDDLEDMPLQPPRNVADCLASLHVPSWARQYLAMMVSSGKAIRTPSWLLPVYRASVATLPTRPVWLQTMRKPAWMPRPIVVRMLSSVVILLFVTLITMVMLHDGEGPIEIRKPLAELPSKAVYIRTALNTELDGVFDTTAFQDLCSSKGWTPGLVFECHPPRGGIGNVKNMVMNCVRYAIEAGAAIVLPQISMRSSSDLSNYETVTTTDFGYMFDAQHFIDSLAVACPQMTVYEKETDIPGYKSIGASQSLDARDLSDKFQIGAVPTDVHLWRSHFTTWLRTTYGRPPTEKSPVLIALHTEVLGFPMDYDDPKFVAQAGRILRMRNDTRILAATILYEMNRRFGIGLPSNQPGIVGGSFYGAHLRVEADAVKEGWTSYAEQEKAYLDAAQRRGLSTLYVTSGSKDDIDRFGRAAWDKHHMRVTSKWDLLEEPEEKEMLGGLTWDQQGLIDYAVLLRSSKFGGISTSTFAVGIAIRRHELALKQGTPDVQIRKRSVVVDRYTTLYGRDGQWPWFSAGMWP